MPLKRSDKRDEEIEDLFRDEDDDDQYDEDDEGVVS